MKRVNIVNAIGLLLIMGLMAFRMATSNDVTARSELTDQQMAMIKGGECTDAEWQEYQYWDDKCLRFNEIDACRKSEQLFRKCYLTGSGDPNAPPQPPPPPPPPCDPCPYGGTEEEYSTCQQIGGQMSGTSACWNGTGPMRVCCL